MRIRNRILSFILYGWALPILVPIFAFLIGIIGPLAIWRIEEYLLLLNVRYTNLFHHMRTAYKNKKIAYRCHPLFASFSLIAIYSLVIRRNVIIRNLYVVCSTLMVFFGMRLVGTMYTDAHGKQWTTIQGCLIIIYNVFILMSVYERIFIHFSFWLLLFAGVGERMFVLFCVPNREMYDKQFKVATVSSWIATLLSLLFLS